MSSVISFLQELLDEDKYGDNYSSNIIEKLSTLNLKQLDSIHNHLITIQSKSKYAFYQVTNEILLECIEKVMKVKLKQQDILDQKIEIKQKKKRKKEHLKQIQLVEEARLYNMIEIKAKKDADDQIREEEFKRRQIERLYIVKTVTAGETKRIKVIMVSTIIILVLTILIGIYVTNAAVKGGIIAGCIFIYILIIIRSFLYTRIYPLTITENDINLKITARKAILVADAYGILQEKETAFKEKQYREHIESRIYRKERRSQISIVNTNGNSQYNLIELIKLHKSSKSALLGKGKRESSDDEEVDEEEKEVEEGRVYDSNINNISGTDDAYVYKLDDSSIIGALPIHENGQNYDRYSPSTPSPVTAPVEYARDMVGEGKDRPVTSEDTTYDIEKG